MGTLNYEMNGGSGNDLLFAARGQAHMSGDAGHDNLFAGDQNDVLDGGTGNDTLNGGGGDDTLIGGTGSDTFQFQLGKADSHDKIADFNRVADRFSFLDAAGDPVTTATQLDKLLSVKDHGKFIEITEIATGSTISLQDATNQFATSMADLVHNPLLQLG